MAILSRLVEALDEAELLHDRWDELAVSCAMPYARPAWALAWWRHLAEDRCALRIVVVEDDGQIIGIAPFYSCGPRSRAVEYRLLGSDVAPRVEPLAVPGREGQVASATAATLALRSPDAVSIHFAGVPTSSPWPDLLAEAWPRAGRPFCHAGIPVSAPVVTLDDGSYQEWMAGKSRRFRQHLRRARRQLDLEGATFSSAKTPEEVRAAVSVLARLYCERHPVEGPAFFSLAQQAMLVEVGTAPDASDVFSLETISIGAEVVSAHLYIAAAGQSSHWSGGFDVRWAAQSPSMVAILAAVERGFDEERDRLDLGQGSQAYKSRLADTADELRWISMVLPGRRRWRQVARLLPSVARAQLSRRISPGNKERMRRFVDRNVGRLRPTSTECVLELTEIDEAGSHTSVPSTLLTIGQEEQRAHESSTTRTGGPRAGQADPVGSIQGPPAS